MKGMDEAGSSWPQATRRCRRAVDTWSRRLDRPGRTVSTGSVAVARAARDRARRLDAARRGSTGSTAPCVVSTGSTAGGRRALDGTVRPPVPWSRQARPAVDRRRARRSTGRAVVLDGLDRRWASTRRDGVDRRGRRAGRDGLDRRDARVGLAADGRRAVTWSGRLRRRDRAAAACQETAGLSRARRARRGGCRAGLGAAGASGGSGRCRGCRRAAGR